MDDYAKEMAAAAEKERLAKRKREQEAEAAQSNPFFDMAGEVDDAASDEDKDHQDDEPTEWRSIKDRKVPTTQQRI